MCASTPDIQPLTIITLGDSLTEGDQDDSTEGGGWPRRIRSILAAQRPGSHVINLARAGWTTTMLLRGANGEPSQIDRAVDELRRATGVKIATLWIGANDLFYLYEYSHPTPDKERRELERMISNLDEILRRLSATSAEVYVAPIGDPATWGAPTGGLFHSTTPDEWSRLSRQAAAYDAVLHRLATQHGAMLVDVHATRIFQTPAMMAADGLHPNGRGYDALAELWLKALVH